VAGADFLQLRPEEAPVGGLAEWLAGSFRTAIADGRLAIGSRLPATRQLAAELQVSRGVVTEAYQRLTEDGHVTGRGRAGTIVVAAPIGTTRAASSAGLREAPPARAYPALDAPDQDIFDAMRAVESRIDLTPGVPDLAAFPRAAWLKAERSVLTDLSASAFGYGDPAGAAAGRRELARAQPRDQGRPG